MAHCLLRVQSYQLVENYEQPTTNNEQLKNMRLNYKEIKTLDA